MLDDLVDTNLILEVLHDYCRRSGELAKAHGVDVEDPEALHDWILSRLEAEDYRDRESVVTRAVNSFVMRDASWHALDLEHRPLERYAWELVAELAQPGPEGRVPGVPAPVEWYAVIGRFRCAGSGFEVRVPGAGGSPEPHLRVAMLHDPPVPDVCVGLFLPRYIPNSLHRWQLDELHRSALIAFLQEPSDGPDSPTRWRFAVELWRRFHDGHSGPELMPTYEWLHYEEGHR